MSAYVKKMEIVDAVQFAKRSNGKIVPSEMPSWVADLFDESGFRDPTFYISSLFYDNEDPHRLCAFHTNPPNIIPIDPGDYIYKCMDGTIHFATKCEFESRFERFSQFERFGW